MKPDKLTVNGCGRKSPRLPGLILPKGQKSIRSAEALRIHYGVDNGTRTHDLQSHNLTP